MNANLLKGCIVSCGLTVKQVADKIGIGETTFYRKMNGQSDFYREEISKICDILSISDPVPIFFAKQLAETQEKN